MAREKTSVEATVRNIRRQTRKKYCTEEKIRIVLEALRGEMSVAELCRREGISQGMYYKWSKEFLEAGKQRSEQKYYQKRTQCGCSGRRREMEQLKPLVAELSLKNRVLKNSLLGIKGKTWDD